MCILGLKGLSPSAKHRRRTPNLCTRIWVRAMIGLLNKSHCQWREIRNAFHVIRWVRTRGVMWDPECRAWITPAKIMFLSYCSPLAHVHHRDTGDAHSHPPPPPPPLQSLLGLLKRVASNNGMIVMSRTWNKERNLQSLTGFKPSLLLWPPQYNAGPLFSSLRFWETGKPLRFLASKCVIWLWAQLKVEWLSVSTHPVVNIFVLVLQVHWWDDSRGALRFS